MSSTVMLVRTCLRAIGFILAVNICFVAAQTSPELRPLQAVPGDTSTPKATQQLEQQPQSIFLKCGFPDIEAATQRFSKVLSLKTVSSKDAENSVLYPQEFKALDTYLSTAYAEVWERLRVERLGKGNYSYLITWQGSQPELRPALFISHLDVVPVTPGTEQDWTHPAFSGRIADGFIWGRGALDVKVGVVGLLEAAMALLNEGYQPKRTIMLAFGQDEESSGFAGAAQIAAKLAAAGTRLEFIWDEGGEIYAGGLPPVTSLPVALVATAEKLDQGVKVAINSRGGHSSMPPVNGDSIGARLGAFLSAMTESPPAPRLESPTRDLVEGLLQLPGASRNPLLASLFKNSSMVASLMSGSSPAIAALVRDTAAVTRLKSGVADNVLPQTADVYINFRLLPSTPVSKALGYVEQWLGANAVHANVTLGPSAFAASKVTNSTGQAFKLITQAIQEAWKLSAAAGEGLQDRGVPVLPYLMPAATDSKHYQNLTDTILRFCPFSVTPDELEGVHGTNERIRVADFERALCAYRAGLRLAGDWV